MLNIEKIQKALDTQPLCRWNLVRTNGAVQRCAMGALLAYVGISDESLRQAAAEEDDNAYGLWERWGDVLKQEYGFTNSYEISEVTGANDDATDSSRRNKVLALCRDLASGAKVVPSFQPYDGDDDEALPS